MFTLLAAHVMYECGMRLGTEVFNLDGLKRQAKCYLACINALKLVSFTLAQEVHVHLACFNRATKELFYPPSSEASRVVTNLTERKNLHPLMHGVK